MKRLSGTSKCLFAAIGAVVIAACATGIAQHGKQNVEFAKYYVVIHPDANVPASDADLNKALGHYDTFFYLIRTYQNGKLVKTQTRGTLPESALRKGLVAEVANKVKTGFTGYALQAGRESPPKVIPKMRKPAKAEAEPSPTPSVQPSATPSAPPGPSTTMIFMATEEQMVRELKPILEKYNK